MSIGHWIQAVGAVLILIGLVKQYRARSVPVPPAADLPVPDEADEQQDTSHDGQDDADHPQHVEVQEVPQQ